MSSVSMSMPMSMSMASTATATATAATSTSTIDMSSSSSSSSMDMGTSTCVVSMLWNWNVMDACFISHSWHITSKGMFAGSCIGVVLMVILLEFLRRASKEFDRYLIAQHIAAYSALGARPGSSETASDGANNGVADKTKMGGPSGVPPFRPNVAQQAIRAFLHLCQFALAYFVMLLAMYYNGYMIICIFIGAYIGSFIFHWETINVGSSSGATSAADEPTVCCG